MKKIFFILGLCVCFTLNGEAQSFLNFLNKAAEAVSTTRQITKDVKDEVNTYRSSSSSSSSTSNNYTYVRSVSLKYFHSYGSASASADLYKTSNGDYFVKRNGSYYRVRKNYSYDESSYDSQSPFYYEYYIDASSRYYFNY